MDRKHQLLAHCLALAKLDPEYAVTAAQFYEALEPWLLENLTAKVKQELRRSVSKSTSKP